MNLLTLSSQQAAAALADPPSDRKMKTFSLHQGMVGVRPEHVRIGDTGVAAQIIAADYLGSETILRIRLDDQVLFARTGNKVSSGPEAKIHVSWPKAAVCLFDKNGNRYNK